MLYTSYVNHDTKKYTHIETHECIYHVDHNQLDAIYHLKSYTPCAYWVYMILNVKENLTDCGLHSCFIFFKRVSCFYF